MTCLRHAKMRFVHNPVLASLGFYVVILKKLYFPGLKMIQETSTCEQKLNCSTATFLARNLNCLEGHYNCL